MLGLPPETPWDADIETLAAVCADFAKLCKDFFLAQGIVLEPLSRLGRIDMRREGIVQAELTGENVHHNAKSIVGDPGCIALVVSNIGRL